MPRFFVDAALTEGASVSLPPAVVRHLHVLRCRAGEEIVLFNGGGFAYPAVLEHIGKREADARILAERPSESESPLSVTLVQAVSAGEKMDFIVQKSVELGVNEIFPVVSTRSVARLDGERAAKRVARWQEIAVAACEQSGRDTVPAIRPLLPFTQALALLPAGGTRLLMSPRNGTGLRTLPPTRHAILAVGPEGGWTEQEAAAAAAAGFAAVTLGRRVLRTETAPVAALAAMQTLWGDF